MEKINSFVLTNHRRCRKRASMMAGAERLGSISDKKKPLKSLVIESSALRIVLCTFFALLLAAAAEASLFIGIVDDEEAEKALFNPLIVQSKQFITAENSQFGGKIEGTSVDSLGRAFAVDFQGRTPQLGQLSNETGHVEQRLFFQWGDEESYFNGIRFYPVPFGEVEVTSQALVADKKGQVLQVLQSKSDGVARGRIFCKDDRMIEPNDVAVAYESGRLYSTGLNYNPTTTHGDGDIWLCDIPKDWAMLSAGLNKNGTVAEAVRLEVQGRANGIEVSNDERYLYTSETWANDSKIYKNVVWKHDIDQETGHLSNKRLFFDMKEIDDELQGKAGDIDGVRTDMAGNLFLVRNGDPGEVVKVSPAGKLVKRIKLLGITEPTNIELAGPHGTTLFIVGKCKADLTKGCIDVWENFEAPGRAFFNLWRPVSRNKLNKEDQAVMEDLVMMNNDEL